jgi:hypothetical protein
MVKLCGDFGGHIYTAIDFTSINPVFSLVNIIPPLPLTHSLIHHQNYAVLVAETSLSNTKDAFEFPVDQMEIMNQNK